MTNPVKNAEEPNFGPGVDNFSALHATLEKQYSIYNHRKWLFSDPLQTVYNYTGPRNREIMGFIAAMCAYGRVNQILASIDNLIAITGPLFTFISSTSIRKMETVLASWKHRFAAGKEMAHLLYGISCLIKEYGSLENAFLSGMNNNDNTVYPGLCKFYKQLSGLSGLKNNHLLPNPEKKSACKRFHLFLRWMVRKDNIDPGIWNNIPAYKLLVPLDVHMHRVCREFGFTARKQADQNTVFEVTEAFKKISPDDPVKYDFALTRAGILENI